MSGRTRTGWRHPGAAVCRVALATSILAGCALSQFTDEPPRPQMVELLVEDEHGDPVTDAAIDLGERSLSTDRRGRAELVLERPTVVVVRKSSHLDEPVAIDPDDRSITIRLWAREGDDGQARSSIHFGGDVMLGRRYLEPDRSTPYVSDEASARRVVAELGPMASAADATVVNLESVIGDHAQSAALVAKRFLIQSSPLVTASLDELGVDVVTLGNNHAYDWGEVGLASTLDALDEAEIGHVGAALDESDAAAGRLVEVEGRALGIISATTVTGDYVNEQLPPAGTPHPAEVDPADAWQYEHRAFGLRAAEAGDRELADLQVSLRDITITEAWEIVESAEKHLDPSDARIVWQLTWSAFPELQDWVARRGHGGAARYQRDVIEREIARLDAAGASFVVVQLHGGYQFAEVGSEFIRAASRAAIDAGADAVVSHHPHVLQGVEWYRGKLIAYSLGNLVFDQDFLSTFPSAMLRVVAEGHEILEARLLPLVIDRYRPTPLAGAGAQRVIHTIDARSSLSASSGRVGDQVVQTLDVPSHDSGDSTRVRFERNSGVVERAEAEIGRMSLDLDDEGTSELPSCTLVRRDLLADDVETADDLFGWGSFDRDTTDARRHFPVGWLVPRSHERWDVVDGASATPGDLALELTSDPDTATTVRIAALIDAPAHRLYDGGRPVDSIPTYEVRLRARRTRGETPFVRLVTYARHDTDPTVDPRTERVGELDLPLDVADDGAWHAISIPVPGSIIDHDRGGVTALNLIIGVPPSHLATLAIDDVAVLEWRGRTDADQPIWVPASRIRSRDGSGVADVTLRSC